MGSRTVLAVGLAALCGAGAGVAGSAVLIQEGPQGPRGERGPQGTPGPSAEEAVERADEAQNDAIDASLKAGEVEERVDALDREIEDLADLIETESSALEEWHRQALRRSQAQTAILCEEADTEWERRWHGC